MYRKLLIPVSSAAEVDPLIRLGANLLDPGGEIRVLHVIPTVTVPEVAREWRASVHVVIPAHEAAAALDIPVEPEVRASRDVSGEILETAENHGVDGILLTLRGSRRSRNPFVGHTATALLQHARSDVVIVNRLALLDNSVTKILLPALGEQIPRKALLLAEQLSVKHGGAPIVALKFTTRDIGGGVSEATSDRGLPVRERWVRLPKRLFALHRGLSQAMLTEIARERYGLCLIAEDPHRAEGPLLTRRFLEEIFRNAPCPVMAVRG
jgi:nucleotide-binding universal stress UspA family protein